MKIALYGGNGFIGRRLRDHLLAHGHTVLTLSRSNQPGVSAKHTHSTTAPGDAKAMRTLLEGVDVLFHLASDSTPGSTHLNPVREGTANILPSLELLALLQDLPQLRLIFVSSGGAIYHADEDMEASTENSTLSPRSYYGAGKIALEFFIDAYRQQTGNAATILRPSNLYGPGQYAKQQFGIVPTLLTAIREGKPFTIWGDGSARRDFLYIDDFLSLCDRVVVGMRATDTMTILNAGSGEGASIHELCELAEKVTERTLCRNFAPQRGVDMPVAHLDSTSAQELLNWSAKTNLKRGLELTWRWFQEYRP